MWATFYPPSSPHLHCWDLNLDCWYLHPFYCPNLLSCLPASCLVHPIQSSVCTNNGLSNTQIWSRYSHLKPFKWCCSVAQSRLTICDATGRSTPGFPVLHIFWRLSKLMSIESVMPSNHLTLYHLLLLLPSIFPRIRVFSNKSALDRSVGKESTCNAGDPSSIPGLERSAGKGIGYPLQDSWASLVAQLVKNPLAIQKTWVMSLGWEDPLEKAKATRSSILAWRIPWTV